jgi:hypothetical protein
MKNDEFIDELTGLIRTAISSGMTVDDIITFLSITHSVGLVATELKRLEVITTK